MEEEIGMEVGEGKEGTTMADMARIGMGGIEIVGITIEIGAISRIVKVTWAPFRALMGLETPLLAILMRALLLIPSYINHRMPDVVRNPCPACRMEVRTGV